MKLTLCLTLLLCSLVYGAIIKNNNTKQSSEKIKRHLSDLSYLGYFDTFSPEFHSPSVYSPSVYSPSVYSPSVYSPSLYSAPSIETHLPLAVTIEKTKHHYHPYPVVVEKKVEVPKPYPVHITKHVPVPIHTPYLVKVPEPYPVHVPQPYPVNVPSFDISDQTPVVIEAKHEPAVVIKEKEIIHPPPAVVVEEKKEVPVVVTAPEETIVEAKAVSAPIVEIKPTISTQEFFTSGALVNHASSTGFIDNEIPSSTVRTDTISTNLLDGGISLSTANTKTAAKLSNEYLPPL